MAESSFPNWCFLLVWLCHQSVQFYEPGMHSLPGLSYLLLLAITYILCAMVARGLRRVLPGSWGTLTRETVLMRFVTLFRIGFSLEIYRRTWIKSLGLPFLTQETDWNRLFRCWETWEIGSSWKGLRGQDEEITEYIPLLKSLVLRNWVWRCTPITLVNWRLRAPWFTLCFKQIPNQTTL